MLVSLLILLQLLCNAVYTSNPCAEIGSSYVKLGKKQDPPSGYISTSVDLLGRLLQVREKASAKVYLSQYDFDSDIRYLISRANDGHLNINLCSMGIMHFEHGVPLVSISSDGLQLPKIYSYYDAEAKLHGTVASVSPVYQIEGMDPVYYLQANIGVTIGLQDPDARYNHLFPSPPAAFAGEYTGGAWTNNLGSWPGTGSQTLEFINGTKLTVETTASLPLDNLWDFSNGSSLFQTACERQMKTSSVKLHPRVPSRSFPYTIPLGGPSMYPLPVERQRKDLMRVPTFKLDGERPNSFGQTAVEFIRKAIRDGKSKLIIDLSSNNGGDMNIGFNLFRIFFPEKPIYTATRFQTTELIDLMGQVFSSPQGMKAIGEDSLDLPLISEKAVSPDHRQSFSTWDDLYGPVTFPNANMSHLHATFNFTTASTIDNPISGFGEYSAPLTQPFKAQNIIVMTNGRCASTCAILASLLKRQGARSIATTANNTDSPILSAKKLARLAELAPPPLNELPLIITTHGGGGVNFRNEYGEDDSQTPLQFVGEAADCRLFFTAENYIAPESSWVAAAEAMFGNASCEVDG
ncbi:hypothetical protein BDV26DRAFT_279173 [Aspergillus bertholletiae]|uniref:Uncharacterized protein n=1 Tax=Aspergillus bertholletiae TaxID=1226010 RepID=A0A5N7BGJ3_9EURO|nr:hypothetical protein BDV26DRAFT_279173 [Aspergillus bertholletiae]